MRTDKTGFQNVLAEAFRNLTLCLGGIFLIHPVKDELVRIIMKSMEEVYRDADRKADRLGRHMPEKRKIKKAAKPHPAVEHFLNLLESSRKETGKGVSDHETTA